MKKRILALAIPATIENVLQVLVGFLDTFIISRLGLLIVSAVGLANTYINLFIAIFTAIGIGASSMISRMFGAKRLEDAQKEANQSVSIALIVGLIFSVITGVFSTQLMNLLTSDTETVNQASLFLRIVGGGSVFISLSIVFGSILRSTGDTKTPMKIGVITNILNVVLDILLVFGLKWGVVGTAI
ncbi:MAG: MATE family efflux transporter, partial [Erysipelothrix sp.]|nr:MATE family efflux transporter [Erysipelothrix sp.]